MLILKNKSQKLQQSKCLAIQYGQRAVIPLQPYQCHKLNMSKKFTAPVITTNQHSLECSGKLAQKF